MVATSADLPHAIRPRILRGEANPGRKNLRRRLQGKQRLERRKVNEWRSLSGCRGAPKLGSGRAKLLDMKATIELPEPVFQTLLALAEQQGSSLQAVILEAINKEIAPGPTPDERRRRVSLPLVRSRHPGSLRSLTNAEVDDILG